jgi:hypothetical protein
MTLFLYLLRLSSEGADAMTRRLQTSSVSKSAPHPVDELNQPHLEHTLATTTDQIPAITSNSGSAQHLRARKRNAAGISAAPSYHPHYDESAKHVYGQWQS